MPAADAAHRSTDGRGVRLAALLLLAVSATAGDYWQACEFEAVTRWNQFVTTSARYLELRKAGVRSLKERERLRREFDAVMAHECF